MQGIDWQSGPKPAQHLKKEYGMEVLGGKETPITKNGPGTTVERDPIPADGVCIARTRKCRSCD